MWKICFRSHFNELKKKKKRTGLILTGLHIYRLKKSMRICPSILSNPLMIFLWTTVVCNTLHYRNWSFIFPRRPWLLIAINFLRE
uniref:Uncharacterized protein n=1 Tax=Escherichia coli TaxID=562 RepID=A0A1W6BZW4_ECOLX|nr:hypothetical protein [Escherichia coli]